LVLPIEPQLFLSYGRPDSELALRVTSGLWKEHIDCYNYQAKPIMDRLGGDGDHLKYLAAIKFFVALLSEDSVWRELVIAEIHGLHKYNQLFGQINRPAVPIVYVTTSAILASGPYPETTRPLIDPTRAGSVAAIVQQLLQLMGQELVKGCQERWDINKTLYEEQWNQQDLALLPWQEDASLPSAMRLMDREVRSADLEVALRTDLVRIKDEMNRWFFLLCLAPILEHAGLNMGAQLRDLVPRLVRLGHQSPEVTDALRREPIPPFNDRAGDRSVDDVAGIVIGLRQVNRALDWMRFDEASRIARRFAWPATRRLVFCGIYYCAAGAGQLSLCRQISDDLRLN
jgi:hypothetical protein